MDCPKNNLNIYLFNTNEDFKELIKHNDPKRQEDIYGGKFYWNLTQSENPSFVKDFFNNSLTNWENIKSTYYQAVFIKRHTNSKGNTKTFAITFGGGHLLLRREKIDKNFGLMIALNSIDPDKINVLDFTSMKTASIISRMQSYIVSDTSAFGIDPYDDLLHYINGVSTIKKLGARIGGQTSLKLSHKYNVENIDILYEELINLIDSKNYQKHFSWIDHFQYIKDETKISQIDSLLITKLNDRNLDNLGFGLPEIFNWDVNGSFKITNIKHTFTEININEILPEIKVYNPKTKKFEDKITEIEQLKNLEIRFIPDSGEEENSKKWNFYECIYSEIVDPITKELFILKNGYWIKIGIDFLKEINLFYDKIESNKSIKKELDSCSYKIVKTKKEKEEKKVEKKPHQNHENKFNKELSQKLHNAILLDAKNILYGGGRSKIEICDVMTSDKKFIHVKVYSGSSAPLSHLFNQGFNSGKLLVSDLEFIKEANAKIKEVCGTTKDSKEYTITQKLDARKSEIIFCILSNQKQDKPELPFFSKMTLRNIYNDLTAYGYTVTIINHNIY